MITIQTNMNDVISQIEGQFNLVLDQDKMLRTIATTMVAVMRKRVHEDGLDANGSPIGTYSPAYLIERQKKPYNRTADPKIILSRTRQMENDMKAIPVEGGWGIGYSNPHNYDKAIANERRENVKILTALTVQENDLVNQIANDFVTEALNAIS